MGVRPPAVSDGRRVMLRSRRTRDDSGFTLIELTITVSILGIIIVPLCAIVTTYLINSAKVGARLNESKDQELAAAYWQQDVASTGVRDSSGNPANAINVSGSDCGSPGAAKIITLSWTTYALDGTTTTANVTYSTAASGTQLVRTACGAASGTSTVSNHVDAGTAIQCSLNGAAYTACTGLSGTGGSTLNLRFTVKDSSNRGQPYQVTLIGQRRQS